MAVLLWPFCVQPSVARETIWQCGQEFTDNSAALSREACQGLADNRIPVSTPSHIHRDEQRVLDTSARVILEAELRQAEQRYVEFLMLRAGMQAFAFPRHKQVAKEKLQ